MLRPNTNDPNHWRDRAVQMRAVARTMAEPKIAILKSDLAADYDKLADRQHCVAETTTGGLASYTNLLGCLKSATEAREMFPGRNRDYQIER